MGTNVPRPAFPSARQRPGPSQSQDRGAWSVRKIAAELSKIGGALADLGTPGAEPAPISPRDGQLYCGKSVPAMPRQRRQTP
jgi:hypothetical protein